MGHPRFVQNRPKSAAECKVEEWKHGSPGCRTRTQVCGRNQVCRRQVVVSMNHFLLVSLSTNRCVFLLLDSNKTLRVVQVYTTTTANDEESTLVIKLTYTVVMDDFNAKIEHGEEAEEDNIISYGNGKRGRQE